MKKFNEFISEDFTPRKTDGRKEQFDKLMDEKVKDQKEYINTIDLKRSSFINDMFDFMHGVKKIGKDFEGIDGMSFIPGKQYNLFTRYKGKDIVVRLDLSKAVVELCAVYEAEDEPVIVPVKKLEN